MGAGRAPRLLSLKSRSGTNSIAASGSFLKYSQTERATSSVERSCVVPILYTCARAAGSARPRRHLGRRKWRKAAASPRSELRGREVPARGAGLAARLPSHPVVQYHVEGIGHVRHVPASSSRRVSTSTLLASRGRPFRSSHAARHAAPAGSRAQVAPERPAVPVHRQLAPQHRQEGKLRDQLLRELRARRLVGGGREFWALPGTTVYGLLKMNMCIDVPGRCAPGEGRRRCSPA